MAQNPSALAIQKQHHCFVFTPEFLGDPGNSHGVSLSSSGRNLKMPWIFKSPSFRGFFSKPFFVSKFQTGKTKTDARFTSKKHPEILRMSFFVVEVETRGILEAHSLSSVFKWLERSRCTAAGFLVNFLLLTRRVFFVVSWVTCRLDGRLPLHTSKTHRPLENSSFVELT